MALRALLSLAMCVSLVLGSSARASSEYAFHPYLGQLPAGVNQWFEQQFQAYKAAFIQSDGRVVDPQNGGITHSESQGYGMMLALLGNDPQTFESIWRFAQRELQRSDGLFAWKYVPGQGVTDKNNATDGELLIATALALGARRWDRPDWHEEAKRISNVTGRKLIMRYGGSTVLLPGEWARPSAGNPYVVLNMSYFIPQTLHMMEALTPKHPWEEVYWDGLDMFDRFIQPPSDWSTLDQYGDPSPAEGFSPKFAYDAVRIPLYLLMDGTPHPLVYQFVEGVWGGPAGGVVYPFDVYTGAPRDRFWGEAYNMIHELQHCAFTGKKLRPEAFNIDMTNYFGTSLHLMAIAAVYANYPNCYPG